MTMIIEKWDKLRCDLIDAKNTLKRIMLQDTLTDINGELYRDGYLAALEDVIKKIEQCSKEP